uniref:hypothetical protein n=1 Tax=Arthrobacter sp. TaxID=1667 RepID=UPI00159EDDEF|nr:hypothetical protein [Arthrobacter sp.]
MTGVGVLVAALVAIFVGASQHRAQVLHRARQDVADFLTAADRAFGLMTENNCGGIEAPSIWKSAYSEMEAAANLVRLTAPIRIYQDAAMLQSNLQQISFRVERNWPGDDDDTNSNSLVNLTSRHSEMRHTLVAGAVNYSWIAKKRASFLDNFTRQRELRRMRKAGIEGCVDGSSTYDRSF